MLAGDTVLFVGGTLLDAILTSALSARLLCALSTTAPITESGSAMLVCVGRLLGGVACEAFLQTTVCTVRRNGNRLISLAGENSCAVCGVGLQVVSEMKRTRNCCNESYITAEHM